jgi:hypothetical protein
MGEPGQQSLLLRRRQQLHFFLNLFHCMHAEIKLHFAPFGKSMLAPGEPDAGKQNLVADFQRADFFFGEGKGKFDHNNFNCEFFISISHP